MDTKKIVQLILIVFLVLLSLIFYKEYFQVDNKISGDKNQKYRN